MSSVLPPSSNVSKTDPVRQATARSWVIIPAAGVGSRMQSAIPKQYLHINKRSVLEHSAAAFLEHSYFEQVYVGVSSGDEYFAAESLAANERVKRFEGGKERSDTVLNGLYHLSDQACDHDWVWVHDAARPCLSADDINQLIEYIESENGELSGAILAARVVDTIKCSSNGQLIDQTADRNELWRAFTPQVFKYGELRAALENCRRNGLQITDEASAIELCGGRTCLIEGADQNIKITRPNDLWLAKQTLESQNKEMMPDMMVPRIGSGYDVHAFCEGDAVILGGVKVPHSKAFLAHSDGDVLIHAIMDAMLGALALGDIGKHFPDTDEKWKGANSRDLLIAVAALIRNKGYVVSNLDSVIIAQAPKMAPHIEQMQRNIAQDLNLSEGQVSVKATTTERLGFAGREEGIACQASVLLLPLTCEQNKA
jgi:2-C-methyl-D-erythritol 2,4-cyclodiphosphate synthase/2-C-methyl-D-erythritol 4-phosphate cytidylyltransferase